MIFFADRPKPTGGLLFFQRPPDVVNRASYHLLPGESLAPGESLVSEDAKFKFIFQKPDRNLVLYRDDQAIWDAATQGQGGAKLTMQAEDGNLVLYDANENPVWATMTVGHPGAFFQMQNDGNAVVYAPPDTVLWETRTWGGVLHQESHSWLADAVSTIGRPFAAVVHGVAQGFEDIGGALGKIPVIGPAFSGVFAIAEGPFDLANRIVEGERLDKALIGDLRDKLTAIREVAPYVQTALSLMPGIGQGVSAAIGAGLALAQGKPLDEALVSGFEDALPGGPLAKAAFRITVAAAGGENVLVAAGDTALDALGVQGPARDALRSALKIAYQAAQGDNIPLAALNEARGYMPTPEAKQAFDAAVAVAQGKKLQDVVSNAIVNMTPAEKSVVITTGADLIAKTPFLKAGAMAVVSNAPRAFGAADAAQRGYQYGVGAMRHAGVNEQNLQALRNQLPPPEKMGFDTAVAIYKSAVTTRAPADAAPATTAAFMAAKGVADHPNPMVKAAVKSFFIVPQAPPAARQAWVVASNRYAPPSGFITWLLRKIGL